MKKTLYLFALLLMFYMGLRIWFCFLYFNNIPFQLIFKSFIWGLRADYTFLFLFNFPIWFYLLFINTQKRNKKKLDKLAFLFFMVINFAFFLISFIDLFYYKFTLRRSTIDILYLIIDSKHAIADYINNYKFPLLLFILISIFLFYVLKNIFFSNKFFIYNDIRYQGYSKGLFFLLSLFIIKGQGIKIFLPVDLYLHIPHYLQPLANNSGLSFTYSLLKDQTFLKRKNYFDDKQLENSFSIKRNYFKKDSFKKKNIIVFILESFSNDLIYPNGKSKAFTPFLDSLIKTSIICTNSYANAFESNKGIVAILGGLPTFTPEPYFYSVYASNKIDGIGHKLARKGYETSFFMGANYDHFGFDKWCKIIGIENYYSSKDYSLKNHFDGQWGISDHYFFPFVAKKIKQQKPPFFSTIFNLSSHYPFTIPKEIKPLFSIANQDDQQNAVSYVDYSIRLFFESIKQEEWYNNTLFVFSADHSAYYQKVGLLERTEIPIFFHIPNQNKQVINNPVQQIDIVPTILDILNYEDTFNSFGYSVFDTSNLSKYVFFKAWDHYYIRDTSYLLCFSESTHTSVQLYDIYNDRSLKDNLIDNKKYFALKINLEQKLKAFIQRHNNTLIRNKFNE